MPRTFFVKLCVSLRLKTTLLKNSYLPEAEAASSPKAARQEAAPTADAPWARPYQRLGNAFGNGHEVGGRAARAPAKALSRTIQRMVISLATPAHHLSHIEPEGVRYAGVLDDEPPDDARGIDGCGDCHCKRAVLGAHRVVNRADNVLGLHRASTRHPHGARGPLHCHALLRQGENDMLQTAGVAIEFVGHLHPRPRPKAVARDFNFVPPRKCATDGIADTEDDKANPDKGKDENEELVERPEVLRP